MKEINYKILFEMRSKLKNMNSFKSKTLKKSSNSFKKCCGFLVNARVIKKTLKMELMVAYGGLWWLMARRMNIF